MGNPAGFWVRFGASLLDGIITGIIFSIVAFFVYGEIYLDETNLTDFLGLLYSIIVPVIWRGYVIGKRIFNIRIVKVTGEDVTFGTMLLRVVVAGLVYVFTFGIGIIVSAFMVGLREDKRSIHDLIAGTYVAYD